MKLHNPSLSEIVWGGKRYRLTLSFDRVLMAMDILSDSAVFEEDRVNAALALLVRRQWWRRFPRSPELLKAIFECFPQEKSVMGPRVFDFVQDADLIYAAFRQTYGIDLHAARGKLHWLDFLALLKALPDNTRFSQIVDIRARPLPKPNKYNAQEIAWLQQQKARYAIKTPDNSQMWQSNAFLSLVRRVISEAR